LVVVASFVSVMADPVPPKTPTSTPPMVIGILIGAGGLLALALIVGLAVLFVRRRRIIDWLRTRRLRDPEATSGGGDANTVRLAWARAAYDRGDYLHVCALLAKGWGGKLHNDQSVSDQLLLAGACNQLGSDEGCVKAFQAAVDLLEKDAGLAKSLSPTEGLIFAELAQLFPDIAAKVAIPPPPTPPVQPPQQSVNQPTPLARVRQLVSREYRKFDQRRRGYNTANLVLGALSAVAAAGAGLGSVSGRLPTPAIGLISLASAALSTISVTLKPAETAEVAKMTSESLDDLLTEIDLFQPSGTDAANEIRKAEVQVQYRLRAAKNRPPPVPLIAEPKVENQGENQGEGRGGHG
jgi:hypothetical protein